MDVKALLENLKATLTCSICQDYYTNPVTVQCGHSFCNQCLLQCREGDNETLTCPECREVTHFSNLVPNKNLQQLTTYSKMVRPLLLQSHVNLPTCIQHGEKEKLFCEEDQTSLCESCSLAPEHKEHQVLLLDRAADKCKEKLQEMRNVSERKEEELHIFLDAVSELEEQCREDTHVTRQFILSEYGKIHRFLGDEERLFLTRVNQESSDNLAKIEEKKAKLSQEIQNVQQLIVEVEENLEEASWEMLQDMLQDMEDNLARNEELLLEELEVSFPIWRTWPTPGMGKILRSFQRDITLDPATAHPHLILSEDLKNVKYTRVPQDVPDNKARFDCAISVLGAQTFTSGKHYWEVKVEDETEWSLGVCENSISRKGAHSLACKDIRTLVGIKDGNNFFLWNSQHGFRVSPPIRRLGIFLDYEKGHVAFYDISGGFLIYSHSDTAFKGPLRPYLSPCCPNKESIPGWTSSNQKMSINDTNYYGRLSLISN